MVVSSHYGNVGYVLARDKAAWHPSRLYVSPKPGWHWVTTQEAEKLFGGTDPYKDKLLSEVTGKARTCFRFADSHVTGGYKYSGFSESYRVMYDHDSETFGGIVLKAD